MLRGFIMSENIEVSDANGSDAAETFDRKSLIAGVIQKHKKLIAEYSSEFNELESKISLIRQNIESTRKDRQESIEKMDILTEKRQLFYHQAEKLLEEIESSSSGSDFQKDISAIGEKISRIKGSFTLQEEQQQSDSILQSVSLLGDKVSGVDEKITGIKDRVNQALSSKTELSSIDSSEESFNDSVSSSEKEIEEISPRHKWLENRIQSHQEALKYWEEQPVDTAGNEVKA